MLQVEDQEYLAKVRAHAATLGPGPAAQLEKKLKYLENYRDGTCLTMLYKDHAPYSFGFVLLGPINEAGARSHWFSGGLIYYQGAENGVGGPQYSVSLSESKAARWEIHT